ncbi:MAG TPA: UDP-glucose 4-epimerase GalE, partial [Xanthomonadaceae bacterium]|nr:UDP-glucose 4-epimerase GalE [Xanthomonadaceae bacterium]
EGFLPVTFDNLSSGHRWAVKWGPLVEGDMLDLQALREVFRQHRFSAVMHFAAKIEVGESVREPLLYYRNNVVGTLNLLDAMRDAEIDRLVFSSTAAVYGIPEYTPIDEDHPTRPINPYGWSKVMAERAIADACQAHGLRAVCLRYFNAAGADAEGEIGEAHEPESHLIPNIIKAALNPELGPVKIFGNDYPTPDGTCVRDYVHVEDLCEAHLKALDYMERNPGFGAFNIGTERGWSVMEVLRACQERTGGEPVSQIEPRRPGDVPVLVADGSRARELLDAAPASTLGQIMASALLWHERAHEAELS